MTSKHHSSLYMKADGFLSSHLSSPMFTYSQILGMLAPLILDMFFINAISMLTTSMISSSSQESVAAVSMINPITTLVLCMLNAIAAGGTVVVAQYKGRGDEPRIVEASGHTILVTCTIALVFCTLFAIGASPIVNFLYGGADTLVIQKSIEYLFGVSISLIIYAVYSAIFAIFRGLGETKICLHLTIYINISYFVFSLIFINLLHMDIRGTVLALILARLFGAFASVYYLFWKRKRLLVMTSRDIFHFDPSILRAMFKISIPFGSEQLFFYGGTILAQKYMVPLGTASIAANAIGSSLFGMAYAAPYAVANLATTVIGQCVGAGRRDLARRYGKKLIHLGTVLVLLSLCVFIPLMPWLLQFFHPEADTIPLIYKLLWIAMVPMPFFWSMSNIMPNVLRSAGDAVYSSIVSLITMWIIRVAAGYIAAIPMGLGVEGVWICMSLEWLVRFILFYLRFRGEKWLNKHTI